MRRILKILKVLVILGVALVVLLPAALWLERRGETTLPVPTGPFAVGRTIDHWTDEAIDALAPTPGTKRELMVWTWYPASKSASAVMDDYLPAYVRAAAGPRNSMLGVFGLLTRDAAKVHAHSVRDAEVSPKERAYPVVLLRAGASAEVVGYSSLAEDLASHGYVVVGLDAPYRTGMVVFPDGRVARRAPENNPELCVEKPQADQDSCMGKLMTAWTSDMGFVLDRLTAVNAAPSGRFAGRLDMTRVGVFGHSFGGSQAAQFCHEDARCTAAIDIDGQPFGSVVQSGLQQPFMFLLSDYGKASDPDTRRIQANVQSIYDRVPADRRHRVAIRGAFHFLFSDDGALLKSKILLGVLRVFGVVGIEGRRQLEVTSYCVRSFFDHYLKGIGSSPLNLSTPLYPEIQVLDHAIPS